MGNRRAFITTVRGIIGVTIIVFALFITLEIVIRARDRVEQTPASPVTVISKYHPEYDIAFHAPNQDFWDTTIPSRKYHVRINSFGFRGDEITKQSPANVKRIVVLGDSFVYGQGVNEEETLSHRLENILNRGRRGAKYQVVNAGQSGSYLDIEMSLYRKYAREFKPDVVVLAYTYNDIPESYFYGNYVRSLRIEKYRSGKARFLDPLFIKMRGLAFYNFLLKKKAEWTVRVEFRRLKGVEKTYFKLRKLENPDKKQWRLYYGLIQNYKVTLLGFREELRRDGVELLFVIFPTNLDSSEIRLPLNQELFDFAVENDISAIDLRETWLRANPDISNFFDDREHPVAEAFEISAEAIAEELLSGTRNTSQSNHGGTESRKKKFHSRLRRE